MKVSNYLVIIRYLKTSQTVKCVSYSYWSLIVVRFCSPTGTILIQFYGLCLQGNIPTVLTSNGLTTLVNSVVKAGLAEALSGPGNR